MDENMKKIIKKLPQGLREKIEGLPTGVTDNLEEIRVKAGADSLIISEGREINSMTERNRLGGAGGNIKQASRLLLLRL